MSLWLATSLIFGLEFDTMTAGKSQYHRKEGCGHE